MASLREYIKDLNIWRRKNTLQTSDDIEVYSNSNGMTSLRLIKDLSGLSGAGDKYTGYFKVLRVDETHIKIVDGSDESNAYCGYVVIGNSRISVSRVDSLLITADIAQAIYISTTYSSGYVCEILSSASLPSASNGTDIKLISDITNQNIIIQRIYGEHVVAGRII